jgi:hypothetical protein
VVASTVGGNGGTALTEIGLFDGIADELLTCGDDEVVGTSAGGGAASWAPQLVATSSRINPPLATAGIQIAFRESTKCTLGAVRSQLKPYRGVGFPPTGVIGARRR